MAAGVLDRRVDRYVTWSLIALDDRGLENVLAGVDSLSAQILRERDQAAPRLAKSGKPPITMTIALAALEAVASAVHLA
jgi:hypothetical protein